MKPLDWLIHLIRRRLGEIEQAERVRDDAQSIRDICYLAHAPEMADQFISRGYTHQSVVREFARCARSRPN